MSVEGDSTAFSDETVPEAHTVDPTDVDWQAIFDEYAASDGLLDVSTRADAVTRSVDGISNSRQAEALLSAAADRGCIVELDGDYFAPGGERPAAIDAAAVDWDHVFTAVAGAVTNPLPSSEIKRDLQIKRELDLDSEAEAAELIADARNRGLITLDEANGTRGLYLADALEEARETAFETTEPVETDEPVAESEPEPSVDEPPAPEKMPRDALEAEVRDLRSTVSDMEHRFDAMSARMDTLTEAVFGQDSVPGDGGKSEDLLTKFVTLNDRVDEHDEKLTMVSKESGSRSTPDERAMNLRMTLYEEAKESAEKQAVMDRDQVKYALGGGLARYTLLDAMRRAADGRNADIDGSCDLEDMDSFEFVKGTGKNEQSRVRLDLSRVTGDEMRKNLTTDQTGTGGS